MATPKPDLTFADNEKVLAFHGPLMYEAKILAGQLWEKGTNPSGEVGPHYFIHYKGWKQTWDEWVPEERVKKLNEENLRRQKQLIEAQRQRDAAERAELQKRQQEQEQSDKAAAAAAASTASTSAAPVAASVTVKVAGAAVPAAAAAGGGPTAGGRRGVEQGRGNKRAREGETEDEYQKRTEIRVVIPDYFKVCLVDDWEAVTKNQQLVRLPRHPNVNMILNEWGKYLINADEERKRLASEVAAGLKVYFNKALGNNLLYRFERGQYTSLIKAHAAKANSSTPPFEPSTVYGAEHLLRLFVNLPELLAHTSMDPETTAVLKEHLAHFLSWMELNKGILFTKDYENTSSGYQNLNRG